MKGRKGNRILIALTVWICIIGVAVSLVEINTKQDEKKLAMNTANAFFQQVLISRSWNASHRGVYVPITSQTQPNQYLPIEDRDLTTDNGLKLTKINPAYMTRQIAEMAEKKASGIQFHITSLKPIRPENKATEWETRWLNSFEQGVTEQGEFYQNGKITWFRYMAPLITGTDCLKCHAQQGYKEGDIQGGLSVSLPYPTHTHFGLFFGYGLLSVIGCLLIFFGGTFYERKRLLFAAIFDNTIPTCITDNNHKILLANASYWTEFGPLPDRQKAIKCYEHRPSKECHTEDCPLSRIMRGESRYTYESSKIIAGVIRYFLITAIPMLDAKDKVIGCIESFQEITERKQTEEALKKVNLQLAALSITDGLTGIANRRRFDEVLTQEYARHLRSGTKLSLIMLDIDQFKSFNDSYGHVPGDLCLRQVARLLADCATRPTDLAARYGGEEFACILPETDRNGAIAVAEKIRQGIIGLAIPHKGSTVADYVTASLGVLTIKSKTERSTEEIVALVDDLLYRAKSAGRNRVEFAALQDVEEETRLNLVQLAWHDSYCCGNQLIDSQHQSLFHLINELLEAIISARPTPEISELISQLINDVGQHFKDEEIILKAVNFPDLDRHAAKHAHLLKKGIELSQKFKAATLQVGEVFQFLANDVVMIHMIKADQEHFPFIKKASQLDPNE
ncbi:MAG: diguanylate cyclase [Proteobacteria bacterium]|nr:diguanylate cyclase [Pseudomonadota bacterium]MBU1717391.1 diguanylate cyclase [Pseudomonadota bacterium]